MSYTDEKASPPPYTPSKTEVTLSAKGDEICTTDAHLSQDPEALHAFLLEQIHTRKPVLRICVEGSEYSTQTGVASRHQDFRFYIDVPLHPSLASHPIHFSLADSEPAYRGRSTREVVKDGEKVYSGASVDSAYLSERDKRREQGWAPWLYSSSPSSSSSSAGTTTEDANGFLATTHTAWQSSMALPDWLADYTSSTRSTKEFTFMQETFGWDLLKLKTLIEQAIRKGGYSSAGNVEVSWWNLNGRVRVKPPSTRARLMAKLGAAGVWKTCGVAYPLVGYVDARADEEGAVKTSKGLVKRVGMTEEEWFRKYEGAIVDAVKRELDSQEPLVLPLEVI